MECYNVIDLFKKLFLPLLSILFILIASVFHVLRDVMTKTSGHKLVFVWWISFCSFLMLLPFCLYAFIQTKPSLPLVFFALGAGVVHALYWTSYALAYDKGDITHVYPIIRSAPALVLVFSILLLGEQPDAWGIVGILTITAGLYVINLKILSFRTLTEPLKSIFTESHTRFAFVALIFATGYLLLDKVAVDQMHPLAYSMVMTLSALGFFSLFIRKHLKGYWFMPIKKERKKVLWAAFFASVNYPLVLYALKLTNASYVVAFRQISVVWAVLVGVFVLKEKLTPLRLMATLLIFMGAVLVAI